MATQSRYERDLWQEDYSFLVGTTGNVCFSEILAEPYHYAVQHVLFVVLDCSKDLRTMI